ncbi:MAG: hypothetical protein KC615_11795 [Anaerolineae bacterium]|nr:hypothetical protein [Anaerolineae bacterium]
MNKRQAVLSLLDANQRTPYIPAAFFLHFPAEFHEGQAAVEKHIEFFQYTDMDLVKIQYERSFPAMAEIQKPEDWGKVPRLDASYFEGQLKAVEGLVKALKDEAVVIVTLYSPFMCAGQIAGREVLDRHLQQDPDAVKKGMEIVTESLLSFVRACIKLGVDGFYASTQGGEAGRFDDASIFDIAIKPYDLTIMNEINDACPFNILHVCDYVQGYGDFTRFMDYPGDVVNSPLHLGEKTLSTVEAAEMFGRPYMGGLERLGILAKGTTEQVRQAAEAVLSAASEQFILGADCTVPSDTPWDNLKTAIDTAHQWNR